MHIEVNLETYKTLTQLLESENDNLGAVIARHINFSPVVQKASLPLQVVGSGQMTKNSGIGFEFLGEWYPCISGNDALIKVLRLFQELDNTFMEPFAKKIHGPKRPYVAKDPKDLYPNHPDLQKTAFAPLLDG